MFMNIYLIGYVLACKQSATNGWPTVARHFGIIDRLNWHYILVYLLRLDTQEIRIPYCPGDCITGWWSLAERPSENTEWSGWWRICINVDVLRYIECIRAKTITYIATIEIIFQLFYINVRGMKSGERYGISSTREQTCHFEGKTSNTGYELESSLRSSTGDYQHKHWLLWQWRLCSRLWNKSCST
jgi:hypothetical protein